MIVTTEIAPTASAEVSAIRPATLSEWRLVAEADEDATFFHGPEPIEWLRRLDREHEDLRAALEWCLDQPGETRAGLRIAAGLWRYWEIRGHLTEGRGWLERMLEANGDDVSALRADGLTGAANLAFMQGDFKAASTFHAASLDLHRQLGDRQSVAYAANNLANTAVQLGDHAQARMLYEETIAITRELGDVRGMVFGSINLADVAAREGDLGAARSLHEQSLATIRELGDRWTEAFALDTFGRATSRAGDRDGARSLHLEALAILEGTRPRMQRSASTRGFDDETRVYGRAGRRCPRCATIVKARGQGDENRTTFWCPECQR